MENCTLGMRTQVSVVSSSKNIHPSIHPSIVFSVATSGTNLTESMSPSGGRPTYMLTCQGWPLVPPLDCRLSFPPSQGHMRPIISYLVFSFWKRKKERKKEKNCYFVSGSFRIDSTSSLKTILHTPSWIY
jgi:hypothetical protein